MKPWDGNDRRKVDLGYHAETLAEIQKVKIELIDHIGEEREDLQVIKGDIKVLSTRINGSLDKIGTFMEEGKWWRRLIMTTAISLVLTIIGGIFTASSISYYLGGQIRQININTKRIDVLENYGRTNINPT